jgi:hypothetical protein
MLRGKCLFSEVSEINECCSDIQDVFNREENKDLKIIKIENRLRKNTSDLSMKMVFGNVIAELQLAIDLNTVEYEFNHKLY